MTAKEMFEELGYTREKSNDVIITYRYYIDDKKAYVREIDFLLAVQNYCTMNALGCLFINTKLHKAITKQMEELGWLE